MRGMIASFALLASACTSQLIDWAPPRGSTLPADDVIAVGRIENTGHDEADFGGDPNDILGHGWFYGNFHVRRVQQGDLPASTVPIRYFSHASYSDELTFRLRLRPNPEGGYLVCKPPGGAGLRCD